MENSTDFLSKKEVQEIFPEASNEQTEYIIAAVGIMTDLFFEVMKNKQSQNEERHLKLSK